MAYTLRGSGTKADPYLFKNYQELIDMQCAYAKKIYTDAGITINPGTIIQPCSEADNSNVIYFTFDVENATLADRQSFNMNNVPDNTVGFNSNTPLFFGIFFSHVVIDFKGLIIYNYYSGDQDYRERSFFINTYNDGVNTYRYYKPNYANNRKYIKFKNLNFYNFCYLSGTFFKSDNYEYTILIMENCNFSGLIRSGVDSSKQVTSTSSYSVFNFINCTFNFNLEAKPSATNNKPGVIYTGAFLNCTFKTTSQCFAVSNMSGGGGGNPLTIAYGYFGGCKFLGNMKIFAINSDQYKYIQFNFNNGNISDFDFDLKKVLSYPSGYNVIDMDFDYTPDNPYDATTDPIFNRRILIQNNLTVVNTSKILLKKELSYSDYVMQDTDSTQTDYIYNLENLENRGFTVTSEVD